MNASMTPRYLRFWLGLSMIVYFGLGVVYALATPPLEASDEYKHYPVVQFIQNTHTLPILDPANPGRWLQEGAQPPLYYVLMAALTSGLDTRDLPDIHQLNHHAFIGDPNQIHNKNLILHEPAREQFPGQGSIRAIYIIRLLSLGLGVGTLWFVAHLGARLFNPTIGLLAAMLTAFNPMFLFVSAAVNNDSLAILLAAWGLYWLLDLYTAPPDPRRAAWRYIRLGVVLGLGILTKLSLGALLGLTGVALAWQAWRLRRPSVWLGGGLLVALTAGLVAGGWFWRNWVVYGDVTGLSVFLQVQGRRAAPLTWSGWLAEFGTFYRSYWGLFGGVNISAPETFYRGCNALAIVGGAGLAVWRRRQRPPTGVWLLPAWGAILFALLLRWTFIYPAFQGRLIFPALPAINVLWAVGLQAIGRLSQQAWTTRQPTAQWLWRTSSASILPGLSAAWLLAYALWLPGGVIRPAYTYPTPLSAVPAEARFGPITFLAPDGSIQLAGVEMAPGQSTAGGGPAPIALTLYWRAVEPVAGDYLSAVYALGQDFQAVGGLNRHPAWGMVPTSRWQAGQVWRDEYRLYVRADAPAPARLRVKVSLFDPVVGRDLPAQAADGAPMALVLVGEARLTARPGAIPEPAVRLEANFGDGIVLEGYTLGNSAESTLPLTLTWRATATPSQAYTVFVHLLSPTQLLATGDAPPVNNDYPTTLWQAGDLIADRHTLPLPADLPAGLYQIAVGLYDPNSLARLIRPDGSDAVIWTLRLPP